MKILYLDCFSGISGNMLLGAFIDAGIDPDWLRSQLSMLPLCHYDLAITKVTKRGIAAHYVDVRIPHEHHHRHLSDIHKLIDTSALPDNVKELAQKAFTTLAAAEAKIHNCEINQVHFHEVGATDAIVDIIGSALCFDKLNIQQVYSSPLHLGSGTFCCAHGMMPVPAPATAEIVIGMPVYSTDIQGELVTPTGAALLKSFGTVFGSVPIYRACATGYGAGTKDLTIPNVLRIILGETDDDTLQTELLEVLECNIDNLNPEIYDYVIDKLFLAGALDATLSPLIMKKNRPGTQLSVLCNPETTADLQQIIFTETSSIGIRSHKVQRHKLERRHELVQTPYGEIRVKISGTNAQTYSIAPEYEDCKKIALQSGVPLKFIFDAAITAYYKERRPR